MPSQRVSSTAGIVARQFLLQQRRLQLIPLHKTLLIAMSGSSTTTSKPATAVDAAPAAAPAPGASSTASGSGSHPHRSAAAALGHPPRHRAISSGTGGRAIETSSTTPAAGSGSGGGAGADGVFGAAGSPRAGSGDSDSESDSAALYPGCPRLQSARAAGEPIEAAEALVHRIAAAMAEGAGPSSFGTQAFAAAMDASDPLQPVREQFRFPPTEAGAVHRASRVGKPAVYLCGNSLGLQSKQSADEVSMEMAKWARLGVEGHFKTDTPWVAADESVRGGMAKVVGALPEEVVCMGTLTGNLHAFMVPFYRPEVGAAAAAAGSGDGSAEQAPAPRTKILIEGKAFPSDYHAVASQVQARGLDPAVHVIRARAGDAERYGTGNGAASSDKGPATASDKKEEDAAGSGSAAFSEEAGLPPSTEDVIACIKHHGATLSLVLLGGLQYYTGRFYDAPRVIQAAKEAGAKVGLDLAHAVGNVPLRLHDWAPDFACWCSYKYLNSGPGGIAGAFLHSSHFKDSESLESMPRHAGWWGHRKSDRFGMAHHFKPTPGPQGFQQSNPCVLAVASLRGSLGTFADAGKLGLSPAEIEADGAAAASGKPAPNGPMRAIRRKSLALTSFLEVLIRTRLPGVTILTPMALERRGAQLSLEFPRGVRLGRVYKLLQRESVIVDVREPSAMRVAPAPLYCSYRDCAEFVKVLGRCLAEDEDSQAREEEAGVGREDGAGVSGAAAAVETKGN